MTKLRVGDWVEVRSKEEILRTLDKDGRLDEMPFMPEMFAYCGKSFPVYKRAHKTCDTTNWPNARRVSNTIHLNTRCDGNAHGGCQAACLLFWKEAWLKTSDSTESSESAAAGRGASPPASTDIETASCSERQVWEATRIKDAGGRQLPQYRCQATQLPHFTRRLTWWDAHQYVEDYTSGNASLGRIMRGFLYLIVWHALLAKRRRIGRATRAVYDWVQKLWGGVPFPRRTGTLSLGQAEPRCDLNLQPGDIVKIKSFDEIRATLAGQSNTNRGLSFDAEMVPFCGKTFRVKTRVERFIDEKTGHMKSLKTPAVILEGVWCESRYSNCRMFCPRSIYSWVREIWVERVAGE